MESTEDIRERMEQILGHVEALERALAVMQGDLAAHRKALRHELGRLSPRNGTAPAQPGPAESADRRSSPRRRGNLVPVLIGETEEATTEGWVLDRSQGGLCLLVDDKAAEGTILHVRPARCPERFRGVRVEVKSCRPHNQSWNLGCQFMQKISWNELRLFG